MPEEINLRDFRMGIYRHHKGPLYQVLGLARDENDANHRTVVVYMPLDLDKAYYGPRMAVRTIEEFVGWADISINRWKTIDEENKRREVYSYPGIGLGTRGNGEGYTAVARRFTYLGPVFIPNMADDGY